MKIVDANVLLYAANTEVRQHRVARDWLTNAPGAGTVGMSWLSLLAFLRVSTHPRIFDRPLPLWQAFDLVDSWLAPSSVIVVEPTIRHLTTLRGLLDHVGTAGNLTNDAHLAALAIEHTAEVVTFDRDFARFGVRLHLLS